MRNLAFRSFLFRTVAALCILAVGSAAAQNHPDSENVSHSSAEGLELHLSSSKSTYQQGELIPLDLSFTSKIPNRYQLNLATYDRSGRMGYEKFEIEPAEGTTDPLLVYFKSFNGFMIGGLTNFQALSEAPTVIHLDLNEWVRFDKPGKYRVTVISRRAGDTKVGAYKYGTPAEARSNPIDLQINEPDPAWQEAQLEKILVELSHPPAPPTTPMSEPRSLALRELRYLGSADAARESARHLRGEEKGADWYYMFGLIGSPNRMIGLDEMKKLLVSQDFPVSENFLAAMSIIPLDANAPPETLVKQREANLKALQFELTSALTSRKDKALDESLVTAMREADPNVVSELRSNYVPKLIESFGKLSVQQQLDWLDRDWTKVKDPMWVPTLRAIAGQYTDFPPPHNIMTTYQSLKLTGTALVRWYELDPQGARSAVIAEIIRPKPRYSANTLGLLPDKTLPGEQQAIAAHFVSAPDYETEGNLASLLARYADASVLPEVIDKIKRKIEHQPWECVPENYSLSYVEKVDPEAAKPLSEQLKDSPCRKFPARPDLP
jgi:hypothetical protein